MSSVLPMDKGISKTLLVAGGPSTGKTSLIQRFIGKVFPDPLLPESTIGVTFHTCEVLQKESGTFSGSSGELTETKEYSRRCRLKIWDSGRRERFTEPITERYYSRIGGIMIVYDVSDPESFEFAKKQTQEIEDYAPKESFRVFVATKCDLEARVERKDAEAFATEHRMSFFEVSAKTGCGVDEVFEVMIKGTPCDCDMETEIVQQHGNSFCRIL